MKNKSQLLPKNLQVFTGILKEDYWKSVMVSWELSCIMNSSVGKNFHSQKLKKCWCFLHKECAKFWDPGRQSVAVCTQTSYLLIKFRVELWQKLTVLGKFPGILPPLYYSLWPKIVVCLSYFIKWDIPFCKNEWKGGGRIRKVFPFWSTRPSTNSYIPTAQVGPTRVGLPSTGVRLECFASEM